MADPHQILPRNMHVAGEPYVLLQGPHWSHKIHNDEDTDL